MNETPAVCPRPPTLRHWLTGLPLSFLAVWGLSHLLSDSVEPMAFDPAIGRSVVVPGLVHRSRGEAWARSVAGRFGIWGVPDIQAVPGPKVAIWGNSQVEGLKLDDDAKIAQQVTARWRQRRGTALTAYGVGIGGVDIATPHGLIPRYAAAIDRTVAHVVVFADIDFIMPRHGGPAPALRPTPAPHVETAPAARPAPGSQRAVAAARRLGLDFSYHLFSSARDLRLRWRLGRARSPRSATRSTAWQPDPALTAAWAFLLEDTRRQAGDAPVAYVYAPRIPILSAGKIDREDPDRPAFDHFASLCAARGIVCRSLHGAFLDLYDERGVFARGFPLHSPYRGHLNCHGSAAVAEAIVTLVADALHPG